MIIPARNAPETCWLNSRLLQQAQQGIASAFNQVVTAYRRRILGTISQLVAGLRTLTENVAQGAFPAPVLFRSTSSALRKFFEPWLYRLTVNASYDYLRKSRGVRNPGCRISPNSVMMADAAAGSKSPDRGGEKHRVRDTVHSLLASVSEEDRILLTLKRGRGLSLKELEQIYHVNENSLKVRLFRARQRVLKNVKGVTRRREKIASSR